ncbi:MAG: cell division protein FtsQ [Prevotella sp.]|nr:cell division protein FtsQ [Prevotella sp.]
MSINWKRTIIVTLDLALAAYLVLATTSFNKPDRTAESCQQVRIKIAATDSSGFLSAADVKKMLTNKHIYPKGKNMSLIDLRAIENTLKENPFICGVECFKTQDGTVGVNVTQQLPMLRVKAANGEDYYIDIDGEVMQGEGHASDLIVATGSISKWYAKNYVAPLVRWIMAQEVWKNQVEQINILPDISLEVVPRVGNHIACLGRIPESKNKDRRERAITRFAEHQFSRLDKFYQYGLNKVGWNKYSYINLEFGNQIICKKSNIHKQETSETKQP